MTLYYIGWIKEYAHEDVFQRGPISFPEVYI
jgi:hypothetical protein